MNKAHFQSMFGSTKGAVYRFVDEVPEEQDPTALITEKFIEAAGTNLVSVVVVNTKNMFVLYSDYDGEVTSNYFELITNLVSDSVIEVVTPDPVIEVVTPDSVVTPEEGV